jgi:hypothetical protein
MFAYYNYPAPASAVAGATTSGIASVTAAPGAAATLYLPKYSPYITFAFTMTDNVPIDSTLKVKATLDGAPLTFAFNGSNSTGFGTRNVTHSFRQRLPDDGEHQFKVIEIVSEDIKQGADTRLGSTADFQAAKTIQRNGNYYYTLNVQSIAAK